MMRGSLARDPAKGRVVVLFHATTQRIGQQPLGEGFNEHVLFFQQDSAQARRPVKLSAVEQGSRGVDRPRPGCGGDTPAAKTVEVLEREAEWVHHPVADGAGGIGPVLFHALTHGQLLYGRIVFQRWNIRRRRWGWRT